MKQERSIVIKYNGKAYSGYIAKIKSTSFGYEYHGVLTAHLHLEWGGSGIGVGGYVLDQYDSNTKDRKGTAYGLDHLVKMMKTVGVDRWEELPGKEVIVLFDAKPGESTLGMTSIGIAGLLNDEVFILSEYGKDQVDE